MTQVRASHLRLVQSEPLPPPAPRARLRFQPIVRLVDGAPFGMHVECDRAFEDARFGRQQRSDDTAGGWLGDLIERAAARAAEERILHRPLSVTAPVASLFDRDAPLAAEAAAARSRMLPSELRIDFADASVTALEDFAMDRLDAFRRRGFRVGLDARESWRTPMSERARSIFESVKLDTSRSFAAEIPLSRLEAAAADGVALIAERARWRDADELAAIGIHFAASPRSDG